MTLIKYLKRNLKYRGEYSYVDSTNHSLRSPLACALYGEQRTESGIEDTRIYYTNTY